MNNYPNNLLAIIATLVSSSAFSEVYQCVVDGKNTFQQTPCEVVEVLSTSCDVNHDYSNDVGPVNATFDDKYCFYLQLDKANAEEKNRLMQVYQDKKTEAQAIYEREIAANKLQKNAEVSIGYANDLSNIPNEVSDFSAPIQGTVE
jgi:hypothetical protein